MVDTTLQGYCDPKFQHLADEFEKNFRERGEVGASVACTVDGETVVDLWGGLADPENNLPWQEDTLCTVFSNTKVATALCALRLIERGQLKLHEPVVTYWPEFGQNGKENITVAMMLNHSAGLPAIRAKVKDDGFFDWDYIVSLLSAETPFWEPGTKVGYHMSTFGWTVGELVRRASGMSIGDFFQQEIAQPLELDFWIGLPEEHEERVAKYIPAPREGAPRSDYTWKVSKEFDSASHLALMNCGGFRMKINSRECHAAQLAGSAGISNARSLARMYRWLANGGGELDGYTLLQPNTVKEATKVWMASNCDETLRIALRLGLGFFRAIDNRHRNDQGLDSVIIGEHAFGHPGSGGSVTFADPECSMSFSYTMNQAGHGLMLNPRGQSVVDAAYKVMGYSNCDAGIWVR